MPQTFKKCLYYALFFLQHFCTINTVPISNAIDTVPISNAIDTVPIADVTDTVPIADDIDTVPADVDVINTVPIADAIDTVPIVDGINTVPADVDVINTVPIADVTDTVPIADDIDTVPADVDVINTVPIADAIDTVPIVDGINTVPANVDVINTVPIADGIDTVPANVDANVAAKAKMHKKKSGTHSVPTNTVVVNDKPTNSLAAAGAAPSTASDYIKLASRGLVESGNLVQKAAPYAKAASLNAGRALLAVTKHGFRLTTNYVVKPAYRWGCRLVGKCARQLLRGLDPNWKTSWERAAPAAESSVPAQNRPKSQASTTTSSSASHMSDEKSMQRRGKGIFIDEQRAQQKLAQQKLLQHSGSNTSGKLKAIVQYDETEDDDDDSDW